MLAGSLWVMSVAFSPCALQTVSCNRPLLAIHCKTLTHNNTAVKGEGVAVVKGPQSLVSPA